MTRLARIRVVPRLAWVILAGSVSHVAFAQPTAENARVGVRDPRQTVGIEKANLFPPDSARPGGSPQGPDGSDRSCRIAHAIVYSVVFGLTGAVIGALYHVDGPSDAAKRTERIGAAVGVALGVTLGLLDLAPGRFEIRHPCAERR